MSSPPRFAARCEEVILAHSAPFDCIDDAGRTGLADFLKQEVAVGGLKASISAHAEADDTWPEFKRRLALLGAIARHHALERYVRESERGNKVRPFLALTHDDLSRAWPTVRVTSLTGLCEPG